MATAKKVPGEMSVREAGRKGGETTAERHGHEFYEEIGRKGGVKVRDEYGVQFYEEIGHKGGQKVRELIEEGKRAMNSSSKRK
ncbi:MAG TPA: hypothetical protein VGL77_21090 [Armatimonadota bacterium]|jgi:hypothetical protein